MPSKRLARVVRRASGGARVGRRTTRRPTPSHTSGSGRPGGKMSTETTDPAATTESTALEAPERESIDPHQTRRACLLLTPTLITLAVVIGYPVVRAIWMSFQRDETIDPQTGLFVEGGFAGFENYTHWLLQP